MTERDRTSQIAVLTAALHNINMGRDQIESLNNPDDKSFEDLKMKPVYQQLEEVCKTIKNKIEVLNGKKGTA